MAQTTTTTSTTTPAAAELRMNLAAVKRTDPYAAEIVDTSAHVAFYTFNYEDNEWEKTDVEGAFFVYRRTAEPFHSIFINNRLNTESLVEPITADLELQAQPPFLLYRNERSRIRSFWFYNQDELERVAGLLNRMVAECQKKASSQQQQHPQAAPQLAGLFGAAAAASNNKLINGGGVGGVPNGGDAPMKINPPVNIFSMLSKAQNDFDNSQQNPGKIQQQQQQQQKRPPPQAHPQPMDGGSVLAQLLPKMNVNGQAPVKDGVTSQSVMNFFASATKPTIPTPQAPVMVHHHHQPVSPAPPMLQRLISNPVATVEQIEMQQRAVTPQQQQQLQKEEPPVAKENGFKGNKSEWPALGPNKVNKSASSSVVMEEKTPLANGGRSAAGGKTPKGQVAVAAASTAVPKPALMTPTMFKKSTEVKGGGEPTNPSLVATGVRKDTAAKEGKASKAAAATSVVELGIKPEPLTQSQMLQALTYLMKTDAEFMKKLHEAYVKSFAEMMAP